MIKRVPCPFQWRTFCCLRKLAKHLAKQRRKSLFPMHIPSCRTGWPLNFYCQPGFWSNRGTVKREKSCPSCSIISRSIHRTSAYCNQERMRLVPGVGAIRFNSVYGAWINCETFNQLYGTRSGIYGNQACEHSKWASYKCLRTMQVLDRWSIKMQHQNVNKV